MAYVRKVRTTSGAVAVQVARKDQGKVVILAHLGSAHTDAELGILLERARQMVVGGQAALDCRTIRNSYPPLPNGGIVSAGLKSPKCNEYCLTV